MIKDWETTIVYLYRIYNTERLTIWINDRHHQKDILGVPKDTCLSTLDVRFCQLEEGKFRHKNP